MLPLEIWQKIKVVLFDAEGTLFRIWPSVGHIYAEVCRPFGLSASPADLDQSFQEAWQAHLKRGHRRRLTPKECFQEWYQIFLDTVSPYGKLTDPKAAYRACYEAFARKEAFRPSPGIEVLSLLRKQGRRLAIVSNWDERLRRLLKDFGLLDLFEEVFIACELGIAKPDPAFFELACRSLKVLPDQALMIGDNLEEDVLAARRAGLWALFYPGGDLKRLFPKDYSNGT